MARGSGRPMAALVLSDEERSFLERQVRRHRVARSMAERCRMILRCADGLTNKAVAAETRRARAYGRQVAAPLSEGTHRRPVGPASAGTAADAHGRSGGQGCRADARHDAGGRHPLVAALDGQGKRPLAHDDLAHLGRLRLAAAPLGDVQALQRSALRGQGPRHRRPLSVAAGPRAGALRRREEPDPGARPYTAGPADVAGHPRAAHA